MAIKAYWRFNGNSNDASGNGYNGTDTNITYLNGMAVFNGTSSYIVISTALPNGYAADVTYSIFYKNPASPKADEAIMAQWKDVNNAFYYLITSALVASTRYANAVLASYTVENEKWNHLVVRIQSTDTVTRGTVYINGKYITTTAFGWNAPTDPTQDKQNRIGCSISSSNTIDKAFSGSIDNISVSSDLWSIAQIKNEYSRLKGFF